MLLMPCRNGARPEGEETHGWRRKHRGVSLCREWRKAVGRCWQGQQGASLGTRRRQARLWRTRGSFGVWVLSVLLGPR